MAGCPDISKIVFRLHCTNGCTLLTLLTAYSTNNEFLLENAVLPL